MLGSIPVLCFFHSASCKGCTVPPQCGLVPFFYDIKTYHIDSLIDTFSKTALRPDEFPPEFLDSEPFVSLQLQGFQHSLLVSSFPLSFILRCCLCGFAKLSCKSCTVKWQKKPELSCRVPLLADCDLHGTLARCCRGTSSCCDCTESAPFGEVQGTVYWLWHAHVC